MVILINWKDEKKCYLTLISELIKLMMEQSSNVLNKMRSINNWIFIVIFTWIFCSTILTKCFTGLLLKTYFLQKPSLTVNSLEDLVNKPNISVTGKYSLKLIKLFKPEFYEILIKKLEDYGE